MQNVNVSKTKDNRTKKQTRRKPGKAFFARGFIVFVLRLNERKKKLNTVEVRKLPRASRSLFK